MPRQALPTRRAGPLPRSAIQTRLMQRTGVVDGKGARLTCWVVTPAASKHKGVVTDQPNPWRTRSMMAKDESNSSEPCVSIP